jgi:hypothetical protein
MPVIGSKSNKVICITKLIPAWRARQIEAAGRLAYMREVMERSISAKNAKAQSGLRA